MRTAFFLFACVLALPVIAGHAQNGKRHSPSLTTEDVLTGRSASSRPDPAAKSLSRDPGPVSTTIEWKRQMSGALSEAYDSRKLVVVDVYTDWCVWCHRMDENIYSSSQVAALSRDVVFLKLNAEDGGEGARFASENGVTGYPSTFILNPSGAVVNTVKGYIQSPAAFVALVARAREKS